MNLSTFWKNDSAQIGGIVYFFAGLFIFGFIYILFGKAIGVLNSIDNNLISGSLPYSSNHTDAMDILYQYWWALPIAVVIAYIIYAIKNSLTSETEEAY